MHAPRVVFGKRLDVYAVGLDSLDQVEALATAVLGVELPRDAHRLLPVESAIRPPSCFVDDDVRVSVALNHEQGTADLVRCGICGVQRGGQRGEERESTHRILDPSRLKNLILAAVVEQVSGEPWEAFLRRHVFEPLGMKRTGFIFREVSRANFAAGYLKDKNQGLISDRLAALHGEDWNLKGNGGIQASTADMERLYRGLSGRAPGLSHSVLERMITPHEQIEGEAWEGYGLAVRLDVNGKPYRIGHSGSDGVFLSYFGWLPQQDIFFYFVGNNGEAEVKPVLAHVVKAIRPPLA